MADLSTTIESLLQFTGEKKYNTIYADPPWQFKNRTGKVAPEHKRLTRYETMTIDDIKALPIADISGEKAHLYLKKKEDFLLPPHMPLSGYTHHRGEQLLPLHVPLLV